MAKALKGFMDFIRNHGVIGLAVGLALGTQVGDTVKKIVENFVNPLVAFIVGNQKGLENATWVVIDNHGGPGRRLEIGWGAIASSVITLLAVSFVIYIIVHGLKFDKFDKPATGERR